MCLGLPQYFSAFCLNIYRCPVNKMFVAGQSGTITGGERTIGESVLASARTATTGADNELPRAAPFDETRLDTFRGRSVGSCAEERALALVDNWLGSLGSTLLLPLPATAPIKPESQQMAPLLPRYRRARKTRGRRGRGRGEGGSWGAERELRTNSTCAAGVARGGLEDGGGEGVKRAAA